MRNTLKTKRSTEKIKIELEIYPSTVYVYLGLTGNQIMEDVMTFYKNVDTSIINNDKFDDHAGYTILIPDGTIILSVRKDYINDIGVIVHEAFHATEYILSYAGMKLSNDSSEAYAYLLEYLINKIIK